MAFLAAVAVAAVDVITHTVFSFAPAVVTVADVDASARVAI